MRLGLFPNIKALATMLVRVGSIAAQLAWWLMARDEKRRQRDMQLALQQE